LDSISINKWLLAHQIYFNSAKAHLNTWGIETKDIVIKAGELNSIAVATDQFNSIILDLVAMHEH
jgi:hypothetical protein